MAKTTYICNKCMKTIDGKRIRKRFNELGLELREDYIVNLQFSCCRDSSFRGHEIHIEDNGNYLNSYIFHDPYIEIEKFKAVRI